MVEWVQFAADFFLHLDVHLHELIIKYGVWTYAILFTIIFLETGIVVTPFLPGDSLLFAAGTFAATGSFNLPGLIVLLIVAAFLGDAANYWIGSKIGHRLLKERKRRIIRKEHVERTHQFYERYGGKTIVIARFVPIIRTFAPFLAGVGEMSYRKFASYNIFGAVLWVVVCVGAGYFFGNLEIVRNNFSLVILAIIIISVIPAVVEFVHGRRHKI